MLQALADVGYESPSAIQAATIPPMMAGSDVVGLAQTGTGKTAAFAIPILSKIDTSSSHPGTGAGADARTGPAGRRGVQPLRRPPAVHVLPIYGGSSYVRSWPASSAAPRSWSARRAGSSTTSRRARWTVSHLDYMVLDEADEMLQMGFAEDVERILSETPEYKQVALFSATMPPAIRKITSKYLHDPVQVTVKSKTATAENISQRYIQVAGPRKMDALTRLLEVEPFEAMIVFVRTKQATEEVAEKLRARVFRLRRSTAISRRPCASAPSPRSKDGSKSTSWSPPMWRRGASTWSASRTC